MAGSICPTSTRPCPEAHTLERGVHAPYLAETSGYWYPGQHPPDAQHTPDHSHVNLKPIFRKLIHSAPSKKETSAWPNSPWYWSG